MRCNMIDYITLDNGDYTIVYDSDTGRILEEIFDI